MQVQDYGEHSDSILLLVVPATQARDIMGSRGLKLVQELDSEGKDSSDLHFYAIQTDGGCCCCVLWTANVDEDFLE